MKTKENLNQLLKIDKQIQSNTIIEDMFFYFKKTFLLNGLVLLILSLLIVIPALFLAGSLNLFDIENPEVINELFLDKQFLFYYILASLLISVLTAPINAGFIQLNRDIDTENEVSINNIFKHYKSKSYLQIVIITLIIQVITLGISQILTSLNLSFLSNILVLFISLFTILTLPLIIFGNLNALDAIKYSIKFVSKNIINVVVVLIVSLLISIAGLFAFCIGMIFTIPIYYSAQFVLYKHIIGFEDTFVFDIENEQKNN